MYIPQKLPHSSLQALANALDFELRSISRNIGATPTSTGSTVVQNITYGGDTNVYNVYAIDHYRFDVESVTAGSNNITFTTLGSSDWDAVRCDLINSSGDVTNLINQISSKTATGFTVQSPEAGTLYYYISLREFIVPYRFNVESVTTGDNDIVFATAFAGGTDYDVVRCDLINSGGDIIELKGKVSNKTVSGLRVNCPEGGTLYLYVSVKN